MKIIKQFLICSFLLLTSPISIAEKNAVDAVVIMDSSGSMKKTDPNNLRKPAAKLFLSLLNNQDRASVMSFSDNGYPITYLNSLDTDKNIQMTLDATDKISNRGVYTNIYAAIERALKLIEADKSERAPIIVLLSDGEMDIGDKTLSEQLSQQLINETLPKLINAGIKVYSIAFTENSDRELLTQLSENSGGFCKVAQNDAELHLAFTSIFEQSKTPDMLPLTENKFLADASIQEITIVASKASIESKIFLEKPNKERFDATVDDNNVKWFISDTFDMITIKKPDQGEWKILFSDDNNKAYIVADMKMRTHFDFINNSENEKVETQAWLEKEDAIVTETSLLDTIDANIEIVTPNDETISLPIGPALNEENLLGKYIANYSPKEAGTYFATVTLKSQTFERQKTFSFRSNGAPIAPVIVEPVVEPIVEPPVVEAPIIEEKQIDESTDEKDQNTLEEAEPEEENTLQSVLIFVAVNVVIIIIGLIVFLVMRLRKAKAASADAEPEVADKK